MEETILIITIATVISVIISSIIARLMIPEENHVDLSNYVKKEDVKSLAQSLNRRMTFHNCFSAGVYTDDWDKEFDIPVKFTLLLNHLGLEFQEGKRIVKKK